MRKSQLYSQIFVYVLAIMIVSFIIVYGYNSIHIFKEKAEQVACQKFKNDLSNAVESISSDFGSVKRKDLQLCAGYSEACFVETFDDIEDKNDPYFRYIGYNPAPTTKDPLIIDSIKSSTEKLLDTKKNVFLIDNIAKESFYAGNISIQDDVLCIKAINNQISLKLEGKGNHVLLSEWK